MGCRKNETATAAKRIQWDGQPEIRSNQFSPRSSSNDSKTLFELLPAEKTGIDFSNQLEPVNRKRFIEFGSGLAMGDFNGDGKTDVFLCASDGENRLYKNLGEFRFEDVTKSAGIDPSASNWSTGATFVDIDNDGDRDLYVCRLNAANQLFINDGSGHFSESAEKFGLAFSGASAMASFLDYDNDGDLDLYLLTHRVLTASEETKGVVELAGQQKISSGQQGQFDYMFGRLVEAGKQDLFFVNQGDGRFVESAFAAGLGGYHIGGSAICCDFNDDGWQDIFVANNYFSPDQFYRNDQNGGFQNLTDEALPHTSWFSKGSDFGDLNNDGQFDFVVSDRVPTNQFKEKTLRFDIENSPAFSTIGETPQYARNSVFINSGTVLFFECGQLAGLSKTDFAWSARIADLDCDGREDVFFTNGTIRNEFDADLQVQAMKLAANQMLVEKMNFSRRLPRLKESNFAFKNQGNFSFRDTSQEWGLGLEGVSHGAAFADLDNDGDLDLIVNNMAQPAAVYKNNQPTGNSISFRFMGVQSNSFGIGAKVTIETENGIQIRQLSQTRGYMSSDDDFVTFGIGDTTTVKQVKIRWPSGIEQTFNNLDANKLFFIREEGQSQALKTRADENASAPLFSDISASSNLSFMHKEIPFDDFSREALLPNKLSELGPGVAVGDINKDSFLDIVVAGSRGQELHMYIQSEDGKFVAVRGPWRDHFHFEDMMPLLFDADGDDDLDLYVVSGSNEFNSEDSKLRDRYYENIGKMVFVYREKNTPKTVDSGSAVCAADFDRDGDLDLFVGGRQVVRRFPETPESRLLQNENGKFIEITNDATRNLKNVGMVTSAIWSDFNSDGWIDLVVANDWGSIHFFENQQGRLVDATPENVVNLRGRWQSIASGDIDHDGDIDYVVSNIGLNTIYESGPIKIYYDDFDGNSNFDLISVQDEGGIEYPRVGRVKMVKTFPFLFDRFPNFESYATSPVASLFEGRDFDSTNHLLANTLEHCVLTNQGNGNFAISKLPKMSQMSSGSGIALVDVDADGNLDVILAQNDFSPSVESGRYDGGMSLVMLGDGTGNFDSLSPSQSGIWIKHDAQALVSGDFNSDGKLDLVFSVNQHPLRYYTSQKEDLRTLTVRLKAKSGNSFGIGSMVTLVDQDGQVTSQEVKAGEGYLSQSSTDLIFGLGQSSQPKKIVVRWPNGESTETTSGFDQQLLIIRQN